MNIKIIGYYGHSNLGDEQYKVSISYIIEKMAKESSCKDYNIEFIDCDIVKTKSFHVSDIIILGGGDVINEYFLDSLFRQIVVNNELIVNKVIGFSVGIPYLSILKNSKYIKFFETLYIRTFQEKIDIPSINIHYIQDISCVLHSIPRKLTYTLPESMSVKYKKKVCFSLSRHIYDVNCVMEYNNILNSFVKFIEHLIKLNYIIILLPFNTKWNAPCENDILIHNDIYNRVINKSVIYNIQISLNYTEVLDIYSKCDLIIPMRYHACLFSMYAAKPMLPLFTTRKIENFLKDISWNYYIKLPVNENYLPIDLPHNDLINSFNSLIKNGHKITSILKTQNTFNKMLINNIPNIFLSKKKIVVEQKNKLDKINECLLNYNKTTLSTLLYVKNEQEQNIIVQIISFFLTDGNYNSPYNYGLKSKIFEKNTCIIDELNWIIEDFSKKNNKIDDNTNGIFNLTFINQDDHSGSHRSGWNYVYNNILNLHNSKSDLFLDLYLDRPFHWNSEINKILGVIPYTCKWIGFVHHTFEEFFSNYNNFKLLENPEFITSLYHCKGLFVLSIDLKNKFINEFKKLGLSVPVYSFIHPTDTSVALFSFNKFIKNNDKKIINIGGWLRNIHSFYKLEIINIYQNQPRWCFSDTFFPISKYILKGKHMNNYFPNDTLLSNMKHLLTNVCNCSTDSGNCSTGSGNCSTDSGNCSTDSGNCSTDSGNCSTNNCFLTITNNWNKHFYKDTENILNSVKIIDYINNNDYDELLTTNIVFLNLVDCAAVNTLIECITRNTPIIINKIPPVVEVLGENYPLYYTHLSEVSKLVTYKTIYKAYKYLMSMNKTCYTIEYFKQQLISVVNTLNL